MNTFLSILSVKTNNFSNEKITIGLLAVTAGEVFFSYSYGKLKLVSKLINEKGSDTFLTNILSQINNTIETVKKENDSKQLVTNLNKSLFSTEYFEYLNKYTNGLVQFSEPFFIGVEMNQMSFSSYYEKFIGENMESVQKEGSISFQSKLKPFFKKEGLSDKADLKYIMDPDKFKGVLKSVQIPLITVNGSINALQVIDFSSQPKTIANHLYETKIIYEALTSFSKDINNKVKKLKVAFEEPKLKTEQHHVFDLAYKEYNAYFNFINPDQVDTFTEKVSHSNNTKFSALVN